MSAGISLKDNGVLIIQRVKKEDEGMYECQATNTKGVATSSAVINVLGGYFPFLINSTMQLQSRPGTSSQCKRTSYFLLFLCQYHNA